MSVSANDARLKKILKQYPKEMVEQFYESGMLKTEKYDSSKLGIETKKTVKEFCISPVPAVDTQYKNECGGMSSAYVMRFYGESVTGASVYSRIKDKNADGTISPRPLKNFWETKTNYDIYVCNGTIADIKEVVSQNIPVIVLINCPGGWHYVPVVGFDSKYIYIQDSVAKFRNVTGQVYNRKETYSAFEKLWDVVLPESDHLMFIVRKK